MPGQGLTVHLGHHQVQEHQVRPRLVQALEGLGAARCPGHLESVAAQAFGQGVEVDLVVVDEEQSGFAHASSIIGLREWPAESYF